MDVLKAELERRKSSEKCQFYEPNERVEKFVSLVGTKDNLVFTLSAANGIGKTTVLVNLAASIIWGPQNKYFDYPRFKDWPYEKRIRFVSEPAQVKESGPFPTEVAKWWPKGRYQAFKGGQHYVSEYKAGDWILEVMTYEQAAQQHEGANLGVVLFNEPPPRHLWTPNISRLRTGGFAVVAMTPLTQAGWFFDEVIPRNQETVVYADVETACKQHGTRGHLEHNLIEKMISEYSAEEREARIDGKALYLRGLIFKTFDPAVHVLKEPVKAPYSASMYLTVDPHDDKPFACIWGFPDHLGDVYIVDEWPNEEFHKMHNCQLTVEDYVKLFRDKESQWNVRQRIMDRRYGEASRTTNRKTLREEFESKGMYFEQSYSAQEEIETGIIKVRSYLQYDRDKPISALNHPKLYINPGCTNTIRALSRWSRDPKTGNVNDDSYKDFCDAVRYFLMSSPKVDQPLPPHQAKKTYGG